MESSKIYALLFICVLFISSASPVVSCGHCKKPGPHKKHKPSKKPKGPITAPLPPPSHGGKPPYPPPPPGQPTCPIDTVKLGACVDLLGWLVHIGVGNPVVNQCCPVLQGLLEIEAAVCLCTTLKLKLLNLNIYVPLALQLLLTCGKSPPPGYTCSL